MRKVPQNQTTSCYSFNLLLLWRRIKYSAVGANVEVVGGNGIDRVRFPSQQGIGIKIDTNVTVIE